VRPLILIVCTVAVLFGLPRLAAYFREPLHFRLILDTSDNRAKNVNRTPAASTAIAPASNAEKGAIAQANSATPSLPTSEADLIVAIQQELARIGYYGGPITAGWTEGVRDAVRKFSGSGRTKPSQQLLTALRAAKPEFQGNVTPQGGAPKFASRPGSDQRQNSRDARSRARGRPLERRIPAAMGSVTREICSDRAELALGG